MCEISKKEIEKVVTKNVISELPVIGAVFGVCSGISSDLELKKLKMKIEKLEKRYDEEKTNAVSYLRISKMIEKYITSPCKLSDYTLNGFFDCMYGEGFCKNDAYDENFREVIISEFIEFNMTQLVSMDRVFDSIELDGRLLILPKDKVSQYTYSALESLLYIEKNVISATVFSDAVGFTNYFVTSKGLRFFTLFFGDKYQNRIESYEYIEKLNRISSWKYKKEEFEPGDPRGHSVKLTEKQKLFQGVIESIKGYLKDTGLVEPAFEERVGNLLQDLINFHDTELDEYANKMSLSIECENFDC